MTWLAAALLVALFAACGGGPDETSPTDPSPTDPPQTAVHVRQEINTLSAEQIDAYRQGVALMQQRDVSDQTSWLYQANIHGFPGNAGACPATPGEPLEAWATCQHGNFFFLSWHRMYLYYFERILRSAVREATGDPEYDFSLPYWDYEDPSNHDLPEPFRNPADASNSLYVAQRAANCNAGQECVSAQVADAEVALSLLPFCNCPSGQTCTGCTANLFPDEAFGSQFTAVPQHSSGNFGELESQPHNVVHVAVGGNFGWMSYVTCAARDPIFWLHHANIDRLWQVWLNQGNRANPLEADNWKTHKFVFFDENKTKVEMTGCEILNMATQLDYEYSGVPVENVVLCDDTEGQGVGAPGGAPAEEPRTLVAGEPATHELGNEPTRVSVDVPADAGQQMLAIAAGEAEDKHLRVVVQGLKMVHPGAHYQVYLNLPAGQEPDPTSVYFLGHIAIFGEVHEGDPGGSRSFDITEKVRELKARDEWQGKVELSFVRGNPETAEGVAPNAEAPDVFMRFSHISVVER